MRSLALTAALLAAVIFPATASADRADCPKKLESTYSSSYKKVAKKHGKRAPGRNIRKHGVLFKGNVFDATCGELRRSRAQLKKLLRPPVYPTLVRQNVPPAQPPAGVHSSGYGAGATLEAIAACESGGSPTAISQNGLYRGKYQFNDDTWQSVGGSGDPAAAPESEQDMRAAMLYARRGAQPWPVCGR